MNDMMPRAMRPKRTEIMTIVNYLWDDRYLNMSIKELVGACMKDAGGSINPARLEELWKELHDEAGV